MRPRPQMQRKEERWLSSPRGRTTSSSCSTSSGVEEACPAGESSAVWPSSSPEFLSRRPHGALLRIEHVTHRPRQYVGRKRLLQKRRSRNAVLQHLVVCVTGDVEHLHFGPGGAELLC